MKRGYTESPSTSLGPPQSRIKHNPDGYSKCMERRLCGTNEIESIYSKRNIQIKQSIGFEITGTLQAPSKANGFQEGQGWITFEKINQLTIYGGGTFDGNGESSWGQHCKRTQYCSKLPVNIRMNYLNDTVIKSIRSVDSKQFHFAIIGAVNLKEKRLVVSVKGAKEAICLIENF
ncbi:hypothetical protein CsatB_019007 [Cannabis sativa]